eukprot:443423_1
MNLIIINFNHICFHHFPYHWIELFVNRLHVNRSNPQMKTITVFAFIVLVITNVVCQELPNLPNLFDNVSKEDLIKKFGPGFEKDMNEALEKAFKNRNTVPVNDHAHEASKTFKNQNTVTVNDHPAGSSEHKQEI